VVNLVGRLKTSYKIPFHQQFLIGVFAFLSAIEKKPQRVEFGLRKLVVENNV